MKLKHMLQNAFVLMISIFIIQCKKTPQSKTELEKLPPITQNGSNTLGCLINGIAWLPNDNSNSRNFKLQVDPGFAEGSFTLAAYQVDNKGNITHFSFGSLKCKNSGVYFLSDSGQVFTYSDTKVSCSFENLPGVYRSGSFTITRYDLTSRIFSGTFEYTIFDKTCGDTLHFTNGRFDKQL
ncbi:MAG: hypothetical protein NVS3B19_19590 [Ginsengibacter sp.]